MTNKNKYLLDTERLKKLEPIMRECGVDSKIYILPPLVTEQYKQPEPLITTYQSDFMEYRAAGGNVNNSVSTFDHADLESVLPDWVFIEEATEPWDFLYDYLKGKTTLRHRLINVDWLQTFADDISWRIGQIRILRGQEKLEAMTDLAILLHENGIKLKDQK